MSFDLIVCLIVLPVVIIIHFRSIYIIDNPPKFVKGYFDGKRKKSTKPILIERYKGLCQEHYLKNCLHRMRIFLRLSRFLCLTN